MDKINRFKIGIVFNFSKGWLGGVYYILNIIKSLNYLEDKDKPELIVFYNRELTDFIKEINYTYLNLIPFQFTSLYKGYLLSWLKRKNLFVEELTKMHKLDAVFPIRDYPVKSGNYPNVVSWNADFQHKFYPGFFSKRTLFGRELRFKFLLRNSTDLVLSSHDAANHLQKFYTIPSKLNVHVLHFVSIIDDFSFINIDELRKKYKLPEKYFIISNQFHQHKNHIVALRALNILRNKDKDVHLVITGKIKNTGNEQYIKELTSFIVENNLHDSISFLGVLPRHDQLSLMKHAQAVIQPSLFEGWSTVVEDAKSLQVPLIVSDISVNREQLGNYALYFNPHDYKKLSEIILLFTKDYEDIYREYRERVRTFATNFIRIITDKELIK